MPFAKTDRAATCSGHWRPCGPTPLMLRAREDLVERLPEPHRPVANSDFRRDGKAASLDVDEQLAPALRVLTHTDLEADDLLLSFGRGQENDQDRLGLRLHQGLKVNTARPDVDIAPGREITALPAVIFLLPLFGQARNHNRGCVSGVGVRQSRIRDATSAASTETETRPLPVVALILRISTQRVRPALESNVSNRNAFIR